MRLWMTVGALLLALPMTGQTEEPNIQPGKWKYEATTKVDAPGDGKGPTQSNTNERCVTEDDIGEGAFTPGQQKNCEVVSRNVTSSSMNAKLECKQGGRTAVITQEMEFNGDEASGMVEMQMDTPNGTTTSQTKVNAQRVGDC